MNNNLHITQEVALQTLEIELSQVSKLQETIKSQSFVQACDYLLACTGKVICMGIGKSGHIARKIAASLSSTGTSAFFVHPCEAGHGDLGMIKKGDVVIFISNSGESVEFNQIYPYFHQNEIPVIAITNNSDSSLAHNSAVCLELRVNQEACPLELAPTATSTNTLVLGDCLIVALLEAKGFSKQDFAERHPFGSLGRKLLMTNYKLMRTLDNLPLVTPDSLVSNTLVTIANKALGCVLIVDHIPEFLQKVSNTSIDPRELSKHTKTSFKNSFKLQFDKVLQQQFVDEAVKCLGIFTDGDLRRLIAKHQDIYKLTIGEAMTKNYLYTNPDEMAYQTLALLEQHSIATLPVINDQQNLVGIIHINDILNSGF